MTEPELHLPVDHVWAAHIAFRDGVNRVAISRAGLPWPMQVVSDDELLTVTHIYGTPVRGDHVTATHVYLSRHTPLTQEEPVPDPNQKLEWPSTTQLLDAAHTAIGKAREQLASPEAQAARTDLLDTLTTGLAHLGKLVTIPREPEPEPSGPPKVQHGWMPGQRVVLVHRASNVPHPGIIIGADDHQITVGPDDGQHPFQVAYDPSTGDFAEPYEVRTPELHQQYLDVEAEHQPAAEPVNAKLDPPVLDLAEAEFLATLPPTDDGVYRWWIGNSYIQGRVHTLFTVNDDVRLLWVEEDEDKSIVTVFLRSVTHIEVAR